MLLATGKLQMRAAAALLLVACSGNSSDNQDLGTNKPAGSACATAAECAGGTCFGAPGQPQAGNPRFVGGYCTSTTCTVDTQTGCGPDEWCVDLGDGVHGFCAGMCSKADGLSCARSDQVCLGLGNFGGCFARDAIECNVVERTGCKPAELCVRIGFDDRELGRCETACDLLHPQCPSNDACYYIRTYSGAFCNTPGHGAEGAPCSCDKCCDPGLACTPDGTARSCAPPCLVGDAKACAAGKSCVPLKINSPWGGCL